MDSRAFPALMCDSVHGALPTGEVHPSLGVHNFYAGFIGRGVAQLLITVLSFGLLFWISWIWAVIEIFAVDHDGKGVPFE